MITFEKVEEKMLKEIEIMEKGVTYGKKEISKMGEVLFLALGTINVVLRMQNLMDLLTQGIQKTSDGKLFRVSLL